MKSFLKFIIFLFIKYFLQTHTKFSFRTVACLEHSCNILVQGVSNPRYPEEYYFCFNAKK